MGIGSEGPAPLFEAVIVGGVEVRLTCVPGVTAQDIADRATDNVIKINKIVRPIFNFFIMFLLTN
jgi:hypothetical protein